MRILNLFLDRIRLQPYTRCQTTMKICSKRVLFGFLVIALGLANVTSALCLDSSCQMVKQAKMDCCHKLIHSGANSSDKIKQTCCPAGLSTSKANTAGSITQVNPDLRGGWLSAGIFSNIMGPNTAMKLAKISEASFLTTYPQFRVVLRI